MGAKRRTPQAESLAANRHVELLAAILHGLAQAAQGSSTYDEISGALEGAREIIRGNRQRGGAK